MPSRRTQRIALANSNTSRVHFFQQSKLDMIRILLWSSAFAMICPSDGFAKLPRSSSARAQFMHQYPCPATAHTRGACPGYVIDHIVPLACGGADETANMQWQTTEEARGKTGGNWTAPCGC